MSPIYSFYDDPTPVASVGDLKATKPWHVAAVIFGKDESSNTREPDVMAWLAKAVEAWQKEFPAES